MSKQSNNPRRFRRGVEWTRLRGGALALVALCAAAASFLIIPAGALKVPTSSGATERYVVEGTHAGLAASAVQEAGGKINSHIPGLNAVVATLSHSQELLVSHESGLSLTPDLTLKVQSVGRGGNGYGQRNRDGNGNGKSGSSGSTGSSGTSGTTGATGTSGATGTTGATGTSGTTGATGTSGTTGKTGTTGTTGTTGASGTTGPTSTTGSLGTSTRPPSAIFPTVTGATQLWAKGDTGSGVTVAVLDTGIDSALPDLAGRVIGGIDLSGGNNPYQDSYGHGTFVAGAIVSNGASSAGKYKGEAPGADLVSIKVAGANGVTSEGQVISGIFWAIVNENQYKIRVLNISLGVQPPAPAAIDPLDQAVEAAWRAGIVVVTSAGNSGPTNGTITSPGDDPYVVTVGSLDDDGADVPANFTVPSWSSVGPTLYDGYFKPDLVAPGRSIISETEPGSTVWDQNPSAQIGTDNFVGSGTSFSTAIVSGIAALILEAQPSSTPNQVKGRLLGTTTRGPVGNPLVDGHGIANAYGAATASNVNLTQNYNGLSSLFPALTSHISLGNTWTESAWNLANWSGAQPNGVAWNGVAWNGVAWNGVAWNGVAWNGVAWNGVAWNGVAWNGVAWNGESFNGVAWNGVAWNGVAWNGVAWNGVAWNGVAWNGVAWNGVAWNNANWNGVAWNFDTWN